MDVHPPKYSKIGFDTSPDEHLFQLDGFWGNGSG
jgi:hypothetical protein